MEITLNLDGQTVSLSLHPTAAGFEAKIGDETLTLAPTAAGWQVDGREIATRLHAPGKAELDGWPATYSIEALSGVAGAGAGGAMGGQVKAPMTGRLVQLRTKMDQDVAAGDVLFVLEAMKMQNEVRSPIAGKVTGIHAKEGDTLGPNAVVIDVTAH